MLDVLLEKMAESVASSSDYRVLRRLNLPDGASYANDNGDTLVGCVVDTETAGLDVDCHPIVELAIRRFRFDGHGNITKLDRLHSWLQDPGEPLNPNISILTGLSDCDLAGQSIDEDAAVALLQSSAVVVAHNAGFDRPFVERRLPACKGLAWACSMRDIDFGKQGFNGLSLGWLLAQCGYFHGAHRAGADVDAVIAILRHRFASGTTAFSELLETASKPGWMVRAVGAHFNVKDSLKGRGYRWDGASAVWCREIRGTERAAEEEWLAEHVYAPWHCPKIDAPSIQEVTWYNRYV